MPAAEAEAMGYQYFTGPELEFFLFKPNADGSLTPLTPHDQAGYFDVSTDLAHSVRRQMVTARVSLGMEREYSHGSFSGMSIPVRWRGWRRGRRR